MNKIFLSLIAGLTTAFGLHAADGDTFQFQGLNYTVLSEAEKTCEVGNNGKDSTTGPASGNVVIPSKVTYNDNEYTVTALGEDAFYATTNMTSISIPETVTTIRYRALSYCLNLPEVVLPNSVTTLETHALYGNYLERLTLSSGIREYPRESCSGMSFLEELVIPDGAEIIHDEAFNYCSRVTSLTIGNTVKSIGVMSFGGLYQLTSVSIPASVQSIGKEAFGYCQKIESVTLESGSDILTFGINVFGDTKYLGTYDDPTSKIVTLTIDRPFVCTSLDPKEMPFAYKPTLTTVNIGDSAPTLPADAFASCDAITAVSSSSARCPAVSPSTFTAATLAAATLSVPVSAVSTYKSHAVWSKFKVIDGSLPDKPSGIDDIATDGSNPEVALYDLNGRRVNRADAIPGIYISRRADGSATKIIIR